MHSRHAFRLVATALALAVAATGVLPEAAGASTDPSSDEETVGGSPDAPGGDVAPTATSEPAVGAATSATSEPADTVIDTPAEETTTPANDDANVPGDDAELDSTRGTADDSAPADSDAPPETPAPTPQPDPARDPAPTSADPEPTRTATAQSTAQRTWANGCITGMIRPGDRGPQVRCLKRRLSNLNFPVGVDNVYGHRARDAVAQIKRRAGLGNDAIAGGRALDTIFDPGRRPIRTWGNCITRRLDPGDRNYQIRCLKRRLSNLNFPVGVDNVYGNRARDAVAQIKRRAGLGNDAIAGPHALNTIFNPNRRAVRTWAGCITRQLRPGNQDYQVRCLQTRLQRMKLLAPGDVHGRFDHRTTYAVNVVKRRQNLKIDGIASPRMMTGMFRQRLPAPLRAGHDAHNNRLSPAAVAGPYAPPLPANSGSGRRLVYSRDQQRVWAVAADGMIIRSWRVSGSLYSNEPAGTHHVYSRSRYGSAYTGSGMALPYMVRWHQTPRGNHLGFHEIPRNSSGNYISSISQLGTRRSAGCQRQAYHDAIFVWNWAPVGTKVVVR